MVKIDFTQEELKIVVACLAQISYKLGDARLVLPIVDKLRERIVLDDVKIDTPTK